LPASDLNKMVKINNRKALLTETKIFCGAKLCAFVQNIELMLPGGE